MVSLKECILFDCFLWGFFQDCHVIVWTKDETKPGPWEPVRLHKFNDVVWHLSWSFAGNILAVSGGDNSVSTNILSNINPL